MMDSIYLLLYRLLLKAYPRAYREEFEDEMLAVFQAALEGAGRRGILERLAVFWMELAHAPAVLLRVHASNHRKRGLDVKGFSSRSWFTLTAPLFPLELDGRVSWRQAGLELGLFVLAGVFLVVLTYLPPARLEPGWQRSLGFLGAAVLLLPVPALLAGLARGLPRWAYPSGGLLLGYVFLVALWFNLMPFLAVALLASLALLVAAVLVNAFHRPLPAVLRHMGQGLWLDWTRLSFGLYGLTPLLITLVFDDARVNNRTLYLVGSVIFMVAGALVYIRSRGQGAKMIALLAGMSLSFWVALLDQAAFRGGLIAWMQTSGEWWLEIAWMLRLWSNVALLMLAPLSIGLARRILAPLIR